MPLITFTSDIGQQDFIVGAVKGLLWKNDPQLNIVDISHHLSAFNYPLAAYIIRNAIKNFPAGSYHLILVNLFDEKQDHVLLAKHNEQYIGCADNGLLSMILEEIPQEVVAISVERFTPKNTLTYAQIFSKAFLDITNGIDLRQIGIEKEIIIKNTLKPLLGNNWMEGQILFIDNFENVIVNISKAEFEAQRKGRSFKIMFKRDEIIDKISETYADVVEGEKLALFNSANYLEIAINKGNAAGLLGLQGFSEKQQINSRIFYQTVRIHFD